MKRIASILAGIASMAFIATMPLNAAAGSAEAECHGAHGNNGHRESTDCPGDAANRSRNSERFLYVVATDGHGDNPDFLALVGADPDVPGHYGRIFKRVDMPNVNDELHHFGYSLDQERLIVPGLFSNRVHVFDVATNPRNPRLTSVNENLAGQSGYIVPHTVIGMPDNEVLVTMIGALSEDTAPGGIVRLDDRTGEFKGYFGPGPQRDADQEPPKYMYDFGFNEDANRAVSTTFGLPADVGAGINPAGFGNDVAVWNLAEEEVIQTVDLGDNCGALEVRWFDRLNMGITNCPGTNSMWLWDDQDEDGFYDFHQVLGPEDGLAGPVDIVLTDDFYLYVTNYFGDSLQKFDVLDPYEPLLVDEVDLPHPNMLRLSPDGKRVYVSNQLVTTWDNDDRFGGPRNDHYGIWLYHVAGDETLEPEVPDGGVWVDFSDVKMKHSRGPAGPHQMFFDPGVELEFGHH